MAATLGRETLRWTAIAAAFINLGIHLALTADHVKGKLYIGVLFIIGDGALGLVVIALSSERDWFRVGAWSLGSLTCAVMFIAFCVSRAAGLPLGYHEGWTGVPEDLLGLALLLLEVVFVGCAPTSVTKASSSPRAAAWPIHDRMATLR